MPASFETIDYTSLSPYFRAPDARLSEGITYVAETNTLVWIDIYSAEVHKVENLQSPIESHSYFQISKDNYIGNYPGDSNIKESIGVVFPIIPTGKTDTLDEVIFCSRFGIGKGSFKDKNWKYLILYSQCKDLPIERINRLRSNDGNIAPDGTIYIGLMTDFIYEPAKKEGCVLHVNLQKNTIDLVWDEIYIPNSIHWDNNNNCYLTDSLNHLIWKMNANNFNEKKPIIHTKTANNEQFESPEPDGSSIYLPTNELFTAVWSTFKVQVFDMTTGDLKREYVLPKSTPRISCCCLAGGDLFVTTGNLDIVEGKAGDTHGGCLYRIPNVLDKKDVQQISSKRSPKL